jgi:peptidoglycan/xylan/chitin deacetylase (PgdA/CDA1 family)
VLLLAACSSEPQPTPARPPASAGASGSSGSAGSSGSGGGGAAGSGGTVGGGGGTGGGAGTAGGGSGGSAGTGGTVVVGWPENAVAAVTLSYDDGLDTHLHTAAPALEAQGFRGTFFLSNFEGVDHDWALPNPTLELTARQKAWVALGENGHELAGHTVNHPCNSDSKAPNYHLTDYDMTRMAAELDDSLARMMALGASAPFTFAYPCSSDTVGVGPSGDDYSPLVAERFLAARVSQGGINDINNVDFLHVANVDAGEKTGEELRADVDAAIAAGGWTMFLFHGVGVETLDCGGLAYQPETCMINYLVTSEEAHASLVAYLAEKQDQVWTATFKQVVQALSSP